VNIHNAADTASDNPDFPWYVFITLEECDKKCLQKTNCAMFNYDTKNSSCCILKYELDVHAAANGYMERHIVRCDPALHVGELAFHKSYLISDLYSTMLPELLLLQ